MPDRTPEFSADALAILDSLILDAEATFAYEHMSGGFVWSDEFPARSTPEWKIVSHDYLYRYLLRARRCLTLGEPTESLSLWQQVMTEAPNWPGLLGDRRSTEVAKRLRAAEWASSRCYDQLPDE